MENVNVTIIHHGEQTTFPLRRGLGLQALCRRFETGIEYDCRNADCGICIVRVHAGMDHLTPPTEREADFLKAMRADPDERLACQTRVMGDVTVEVEDA